MKYANVEELKKALVHYADQVDETHTLAMVLERTVESMEDVVEVVRCKDCKYCTEQGDWCQNENVQSMCFTDGEVEHYFGDKRGHLYPDMDFFCKYGERRETE